MINKVKYQKLGLEIDHHLIDSSVTSSLGIHQMIVVRT